MSTQSSYTNTTRSTYEATYEYDPDYIHTDSETESTSEHNQFTEDHDDGTSMANNASSIIDITSDNEDPVENISMSSGDSGSSNTELSCRSPSSREYNMDIEVLVKKLKREEIKMKVDTIVDGFRDLCVTSSDTQKEISGEMTDAMFKAEVREFTHKIINMMKATLAQAQILNETNANFELD